MIKRKIIIDAILNIIASAIPLIILQLIALPFISSSIGDTRFGLLLTLISLSTLLSHPFGNVLNNIRLLQNEDYKQKNITGDFNLLLVTSIIINTFMMILGTVYFQGFFSIINTVLITIISCLELIRGYLIVTFRITLNYKAILINNLLLGTGYIFGLAVFYIIGYWQLIYILGSIFSLFYIVSKSTLLKESYSKTILFKATTYKSFILFLSVFMTTALSYVDKLLLYPLLGPTAVSIYFTATILGKLIASIITPISSVMLSYLTRIEEIKIKNFIYIISLTGLVGFLGYFVTIMISNPLLNYLYPDWAAESMELIYITTATTIIGVMSSVIHPIILRFNNVNWQVIISGTNLVVYTICVFIFYNYFGLIGFCVGILIANGIRFLFMILIYIINQRANLNTV